MDMHFGLGRHVGGVPTELGDFGAVVALRPKEREDHSGPSHYVAEAFGYPGCCWDQLPVFVGIVQTTDEPEGMRGPLASRGERLQLLDDCYRVVWGPIDSGGESRPGFLTRREQLASMVQFPGVLMVDRESRISSTSDGDGQVIQRGSKIMNEVTGDQADMRVGLLSDLEAVEPDVLVVLGWGNADRLVWVTFRVRPHFTLEVAEVILSPVKLEPPGFRR